MYYQKNNYYNIKGKYGTAGYDSKFEANYGFELELRQKAGEITRFETHKQIPLEVNGFHICNYYIDFVVYYPDGLVEYVETKGLATAVWKLKWKLFEALYSEKEDVKLTVVYQGKVWNHKARRVKS